MSHYKTAKVEIVNEKLNEEEEEEEGEGEDDDEELDVEDIDELEFVNADATSRSTSREMRTSELDEQKRVNEPHEEQTFSLDEESELIIPTNELASQTAQDLEDELKRFRNEWKRELHGEQATNRSLGSNSNVFAARETSSKGASSKKTVESGVFKQPQRANLQSSDSDFKPTVDLNYEQPQSEEEKAKYLFDKGVQLEQQGRHFEAIQFYRMSMQLDPDVEQKHDAMNSTINRANMPPILKDKKSLEKSSSTEMKTQTELKATQVDLIENKKELDETKKKMPKTNEIDNAIEAIAENNEDVDEDEDATLLKQFHQLVLTDQRICEKNTPQKATHISQLPMEVIMLIFKWVVSNHLDLRSLDSLAQVCKGFYVCARDQEIWKLACLRIWHGDETLNASCYQNWREMYLKRPHLNFDGVYISKASYARAGEKSLDNFYSPWHLVEYYRYMRFASNGHLLFLTTPDDPKQTVGKLKRVTHASSSNAMQIGQQGTSTFLTNNESILKGNWTLNGNKVNISLVRNLYQKKNTYYGRRRQTKEPILEQEHLFKIELELSSSSSKKLNNQLAWLNYEITVVNRIAQTSQATKFNLNKIDFPNFYFSRVKSYTSNSDSPIK